MPRQARKTSGTGIYDVMLCGINRQNRSENRPLIYLNVSFDYQHDVFDHCDALSYKKTGVGGEEYMNNLVLHWNHP